MTYGDSTKVQNLVWGSAKAVVPAGVTSALESATALINSKLNLKSELSGADKPARFDDITNQLAAGIIQEQKDPGVKSQSTVRGEQMLQDYMDDTTIKSRGESYHIRFA